MKPEKVDDVLAGYLCDLERHLSNPDNRVLVNIFNTGIVVDIKTVALIGVKVVQQSLKGKRNVSKKRKTDRGHGT